jgi:hypothetical protein
LHHSHPFPLPLVPTPPTHPAPLPQDLFCPPFLWFCRRKKKKRNTIFACLR